MSKAAFYAVARGRKPGIYEAWYGPDGAQAQVDGYPGARFQGFRTRAEAEEWLRTATAAEESRLPACQSPQPEPVPNPAPSPARPAVQATGVLEPIAQPLDHRAALAAGKVVIYTDGGCIGNPGPGGYGVVLLYGEYRKELSAGYRHTTNNRMELMACIAGLQSLKRPSTVVVYSDSQYVVNGITQGWARRWRQNGWQRGADQKTANADLWSQLLDLCDRHEVEFVWVRGHVGNPENERCDQLSLQAAYSLDLPVDPGFE